MLLYKTLKVKLVPYMSLTSQMRSAYENYYSTEHNPNALFHEERSYEVHGLSERGGGNWQVLLTNERGKFSWVPFELLMDADWLKPGPQHVKVTTPPAEAQTENEPEPVKAPATKKAAKKAASK